MVVGVVGRDLEVLLSTSQTVNSWLMWKWEDGRMSGWEDAGFTLGGELCGVVGGFFSALSFPLSLFICSSARTSSRLQLNCFLPFALSSSSDHVLPRVFLLAGQLHTLLRSISHPRRITSQDDNRPFPALSTRRRLVFTDLFNLLTKLNHIMHFFRFFSHVILFFLVYMIHV